MSFPNAAKGVKKIFVAEILHLIGTIPFLVGGIMMTKGLMSSGWDGLSFFLYGIGFTIASLPIYAVATFVSRAGIINASHDESYFEKARIINVGIVTSVGACLIMASMLSGAALVYFGGILLYAAAELVNIFVLIYAIGGIIRLADQLNRGDISVKGSIVLKFLIVINALAFIAPIIALFSVLFNADLLVAVIILAAAQALELIKYIIYLIFLAQVKKMLKEA